MESQGLADVPRPVHHRIPNFKGSLLAGQSIRGLEAFARSQEVKVDPDKPLEGVRLLALQSGKRLLVPTPRLRTGLFNRIVPPPGATRDVLRKCATSQGVRNYSVPLGLEAKVAVDLVVVGSVAVSEKGWRIGKGEGYADLEYAMMASMGAVGQDTPVVTVVHDCQVVDFPEALLEEHDLTVDYIITPTRVVATGCRRPRPTGIIWSKLGPETLQKIPVLRSLRQREQRMGKDVALRAGPGQPPGAPGRRGGPWGAAPSPPPPPPLLNRGAEGGARRAGHGAHGSAAGPDRPPPRTGTRGPGWSVGRGGPGPCS